MFPQHPPMHRSDEQESSNINKIDSTSEGSIFIKQILSEFMEKK